MIKQYFKQATYSIKENKVLSAITISGTALAICLIMIMVMTYRAKVKNYPPETKRDRMLYVKWAGYRYKENGEISGNASLSLQTAKQCFAGLETTEAVTITTRPLLKLIATMDETEKFKCKVLPADAAFWHVFDFSFLNGKGYTEADVNSGLKKVVISRRTARKLFGTIDVSGRQVYLGYVPYTVVGVVKDVSKFADSSHADVWIPYTSTYIREYPWADNISGSYLVKLLARRPSDFSAIRKEVKKRVEAYNRQLLEYDLELYEQPTTRFGDTENLKAEGGDMKRIKRQGIIAILLLLIVPAVNLSGLALSRMDERKSEIGIRKAFGARRSVLIAQVFMDNFLYTLIGGAAGFAFSYLLLYLLYRDIFIGPLLSPVVFLIALFFCLVLNTVSAVIPAWNASSSPIVNDLKRS